MAKKRERKSSEEVSAALQKVQELMSGPKPLSLNAACKKAGIFPSTYYYRKGDARQETAAKEEQESLPVEPKNTNANLISNAELELLRLKAKLYDKGISLDQ